MEDLEGDPAEPSEDDLFMGLTDALTRDASHIASTSTALTRAELDRQVHNLTFERDQV